MSTIIFKKQDLIEWLSNQLADDSFIAVTQNLTGDLKVKPKKNLKEVTFGFAADTFKRKDDIGHIAFGKTPVLAMCVCNIDDLSKESINLIKTNENVTN